MPLIELDADGIQGNGRDTVHVNMGESFEVDAWIHPNTFGLMMANIFVEDIQQAFDFEGIQFFAPAGWDSAIGYIDSIYVQFGLWGSEDEIIYSPARIATLTFRAMVDQVCPALGVNESLSQCLWGYIFDCEWTVPSIELTICIGVPTGTESSSWGSMKTLFR